MSKAFRNLKGAAPHVLLIFLDKRDIRKNKQTKKRVCLNCDNLKFSYKEAKEKHGISIPRFTRAIDQLLEKGFLIIKHYGGGTEGDQTIYGLSRNFERWSSGICFFKRKSFQVSRGFCKPMHGNHE